MAANTEQVHVLLINAFTLAAGFHLASSEIVKSGGRAVVLDCSALEEATEDAPKQFEKALSDFASQALEIYVAALPHDIKDALLTTKIFELLPKDHVVSEVTEAVFAAERSIAIAEMRNSTGWIVGSGTHLDDSLLSPTAFCGYTPLPTPLDSTSGTPMHRSTSTSPVPPGMWPSIAAMSPLAMPGRPTDGLRVPPPTPKTSRVEMGQSSLGGAEMKIIPPPERRPE